MLTFSLLNGSVLQCSTGKKTLAFYPESATAVKADVIFLAQPEPTPTDGVISWPGEYDIEGMTVRGVGHDEGRQVSFVIESEGTRCAFLSQPLNDLTDHDLEAMGNVDILALPAEDAKLVQKLVDAIDPRVLIPLQGPDMSEVLKIMGAQGVAPVAEYKAKGSLPQEGREVVIFE